MVWLRLLLVVYLLTQFHEVAAVRHKSRSQSGQHQHHRTTTGSTPTSTTAPAPGLVHAAAPHTSTTAPAPGLVYAGAATLPPNVSAQTQLPTPIFPVLTPKEKQERAAEEEKIRKQKDKEKEERRHDPFRKKSVGEKYQEQDDHVVRLFLPQDNTTVIRVNEWSVVLNKTEQEVGMLSTPGDKFVFEAPYRFRKTKTIDKVILLHRKELEDGKARDSIKKIEKGGNSKEYYYWDFEPCYHTVSCHVRGTKKWIKWNGPNGNTKRGEPRRYRKPPTDPRRYAAARMKGDPDYDALHDFARYMGEHKCDLIMVENTSRKEHKGARCRIHGIHVEYRPFRARLFRPLETVAIFVNGTAFAEVEWNIKLPHFGGGQDQTVDEVAQFGSLYGGAHSISAGAKINEHLNHWLTINNGGLIIRLQGGHLWAGCEVALGDRVLNPNASVSSQIDKDGQVGKKGHAVLYAYMRSRTPGDKYKSFLLRNVPAGTASIHNLAPQNKMDILIPPSTTENPFFSSFIRLDAVKGRVYIMGVRCRYYVDDSLAIPPRPIVISLRNETNTTTNSTK